jgi:hypothetical protein
MDIFFRDFNAKVEKEHIFKPTLGYESLHEITNDTGVRAVNFSTSKNLLVKSTMLPHCNICKFTWTSPDGKTHNQTDHIQTSLEMASKCTYVRSFRGADCDSDHCLVVANATNRSAASKSAMKS